MRKVLKTKRVPLYSRHSIYDGSAYCDREAIRIAVERAMKNKIDGTSISYYVSRLLVGIRERPENRAEEFGYHVPAYVDLWYQEPSPLFDVDVDAFDGGGFL